MSTQYYKHLVDLGGGTQFVEVTNGTITRQWLVARQGYCTGDGNPELVGQPKSKMRGYGFKKVSEPQNTQLLMDSVSY